MGLTPDEREESSVIDWMTKLMDIAVTMKEMEETIRQIMPAQFTVRSKPKFKNEKKKAEMILESMQISLREQRGMLDDIKRDLE